MRLSWLLEVPYEGKYLKASNENIEFTENKNEANVFNGEGEALYFLGRLLEKNLKDKKLFKYLLKAKAAQHGINFS